VIKKKEGSSLHKTEGRKGGKEDEKKEGILKYRTGERLTRAGEDCL